MTRNKSITSIKRLEDRDKKRYLGYHLDYENENNDVEQKLENITLYLQKQKRNFPNTIEKFEIINNLMIPKLVYFMYLSPISEKINKKSMI